MTAGEKYSDSKAQETQKNIIIWISPADSAWYGADHNQYHSGVDSC